GSGHVIEDASSIVCDSGVGILNAGWGCNCPPYAVSAKCCKPTANGCGPEGGIKYPEVWNGHNFKTACNGHDVCYGTCGKSKSSCDAQFWLDLVLTCNLDPACQSIAFIYYTAVSLEGQGAYREAQKRSCDCEQIGNRSSESLELIQQP